MAGSDAGRAARPTTVAFEGPQAGRYVEALCGVLPAARCVAATRLDELLATPDLAASVGVLVTMGLTLDGDGVAALPSLRFVQSLLAGVERTLVALEGRPEVLLASLSGVHGPQMAEMVLTQMLVLSRDVRRMVHNQDRALWDPWIPTTLRERTAAVVGLGASGREIARLLKALGMGVIGVSRHLAAAPPEGRSLFVDEVHGYDALAEVASRVDFLVLALRLTPETAGIVDAKVLAAMRPTGYLLNVARGALVDEEALYEALASRSIAGAALDVFAAEPLPAESPLWALDNVFLTPHLAGRSDRYFEQALPLVRANLEHFLAGELSEMANVVPRTNRTGGRV